jgi:hypothetical protein
MSCPITRDGAEAGANVAIASVPDLVTAAAPALAAGVPHLAQAG